VDNILKGSDFKDILDSVNKARRKFKSVLNETLTDEIRDKINPYHLELFDRSKKINNMSSSDLNKYLKSVENMVQELDPKNR
jgi:uncharacterized coiled-coil DUF342 family protein